MFELPVRSDLLVTRHTRLKTKNYKENKNKKKTSYNKSVLNFLFFLKI